MNMTKKRSAALVVAHRIFLITCMALFSAVLIDSYRYEAASTYLLPQVLGYFAVCITAVILIRDCRKKSKISESGTRPGPVEASGSHRVKALHAVLFAAAYFLAVPLLGFIPSTFLALFLFPFIARSEKKIICFSVAAITPILLHLVFTVFLKVRFPKGF